MKKEIRIFFTALMFYTRIPCPKWVDHSEEYLNKSSRYFPLIGILVGSISALVFWMAHLLLSPAVSVILAILSGVLVTGAFHEDGLADVCDGFGGGWTKEKILLIMKDSRIGAYGAIGLILLFSLKFSLLVTVPAYQVPFLLISAHSISRFTAISFIFTHAYAREDETSKTKPVAKRPPLYNFVIAAFFGLAPLLLFCTPWVFLLLIPLVLLKIYLGWYFKKWIGGYTGDCLGATQQIAEVLFYLTFVILIQCPLWKFI
jgi:adenosylcobinamide-GDP ribazoletransferase